MLEFDLLIKYAAGKENLLAEALSRKHKHSLDPKEEHEFIPCSIDPIEDNTKPQGISITTNNLSISPIPEEFTIVSYGYINFKHTDCNNNNCAGHDESFCYHFFSPYLDNKIDWDYEDCDDIKEDEMESGKDTLSTIPKEIFDGYEFDPYPHVMPQD